MTFALATFDLFTYAFSGALQLSLLTYVAARLHWINLGAVFDAPGALLFAGVAILSYLLGHVTYALGLTLDRLPLARRDVAVRETFTTRNPGAAGRPFISAHLNLLLSGVELHNREVAMEITRLRAVGLMVRNSAIPLAVGAVVAVVELVAGGPRVFAACAAVLLGLVAVAALDQGRRLRGWANQKILELAYWVPEIDEKVRPPAAEPG